MVRSIVQRRRGVKYFDEPLDDRDLSGRRASASAATAATIPRVPIAEASGKAAAATTYDEEQFHVDNMAKEEKKYASSRRDVARLTVIVLLSMFMAWCLLQSSFDSPMDQLPSSWKILSAIDMSRRIPPVGKLEAKLLKSRFAAQEVWDHLVLEGGRTNAIAVEVGMHRALQCLQAAAAGMQAYCIEPSPASFTTIKKQVRDADAEVRKRVHLYNVAAGDKTGEKVPFVSGGGTGDHVGHMDMWTMQKTNRGIGANGEKMIYVPTARVDDIIAKLEDSVFVLKVDTQGYEPAVVSGLTKSIHDQKIDFLILEYWPRGMDALREKINDECVGAYMLADLVTAGYTLYATEVVSHPNAPENSPRGVAQARGRPLHDLMENCKWFLDTEKRFPSPDYKLGYWSDVIAVSPKAHIDNPISEFGMVLFPTNDDQESPPTSSSPFKMDLFDRRFFAGDIWRGLMQEAGAIAKSEKLAAIEVGSRSTMKQCALIAAQGLEAHCLAPSTVGFNALQETLIKVDPELQARIHVYNVIAGDATSGILQLGQPYDNNVKFHVHSVDKKDGERAAAPVLRLDDIVSQTSARVYLVSLKIMGEDLLALAGLKEALSMKRVDFILFDFYPVEFKRRQSVTTSEECAGSSLLDTFIENGYMLYPTNVVGPSAEGAPAGFGKARVRPLTSVLEYCKWFLDASSRYAPNERQGFSSMMLAVSPQAHIDNPQSEVGMTLFPPEDFKEILS